MSGCLFPGVDETDVEAYVRLCGQAGWCNLHISGLRFAPDDLAAFAWIVDRLASQVRSHDFGIVGRIAV